MMMSVFRQDRAPIALDHLACLRLGTTSQDVEMISWAVLNGKPALVGLDDQPSIVKLQEAGDDAMSYAGLYDVALTLREFTRMKAHGVSELEAIGDVLYRITLIAEISDNPRVTVLVKAKDETAVQLRLKELLATPEFSTQLSIALAKNLFANDAISLSTNGPLKLKDPAPADGLEWGFLSDPDAD